MSELLNLEEQGKLLGLARNTLEFHLQGLPLPSFQSSAPCLQQRRGAFVTLHREGHLRGCIGHIIPDDPLFHTIRQMAIAAATEDPRFQPVAFEELSLIDIEISVLTPFKRIKSVEEIQVGLHGLMMTQGRYRGLLLPQVAAEEGWSREEFLFHTCLKAGLHPEAWKETSTQIEIFSAQVFGEKKI